MHNRSKPCGSSAQVFTAASPVPVETITLKKLNGQNINGFPNFDNQDNNTSNPNRVLLTGEGGYGPDFKKVGPDPFGMDTESIVVVSRLPLECIYLTSSTCDENELNTGCLNPLVRDTGSIVVVSVPRKHGSNEPKSNDN